MLVIARRNWKLNERPVLRCSNGRASVQDWVCSDLGSLRQVEGILHVNPEAADGAVNLRVAKQDLDGS